MLDLIVKQDWLPWTWVLVLGFPLSLILLGEVIVRLERRKKPLVVPLRTLRNFVLPTLALFLLLVKVLQLDSKTTPVRLVETLLWVFIIYTALTAINILLFEESKPGSWQSQTPKLFLDLSRFFLVLVGTAMVLSSVWKANLAGFLTALGVGSVVIGLALQDSLGNVFSGIALLFERPIAVGDWVQIGKDTGKVIEVTWRSVHLQTWSRDLLVVPNSELAKSKFKNLSRPALLHQETFEIGFSYDDPPNKVKQILKQTALETEGVLSEPVPWVYLVTYSDYYISYKVGLYFVNYETSAGILSEYATRLWYTAKRHNLSIPYPIQTEYNYEIPAPTLEDKSFRIAETLRSIPSLSTISSILVERLNGKIITKDYGRDEVVVAEGDRLSGLYIILKGSAEVSVHDQNGNKQQVAHLSQCDLFGEKASLVSDRVSDVSVVALDDLEVLILDTETLQMLLIQMPRFAYEIGEVMELRRKSVQVAKRVV